MDATTIPANTVSFRDFLFKDKRNRTILILAAVAVVIQWAVFKYFYPFASYIHGDSFAYIKAADQNLSPNTYLIGYSKFLRLISIFSRSDFSVTALQYLLIELSTLTLLFTTFFFYKPGKITQYFLLCFMVFNPLFLHLANLISSDGFFLALSMIWLTSLVWIIHRPSKNSIFWHAIVLFLAFTVRYNAMIYPIISLLAFYLSKATLKQKIIGFTLAITTCLLFVITTSYQYKRITGQWQYSPFSGWQMANNAMYAYRYVDSANRKPVEKKYTELDNMIREYFDSTRNIFKYPHEALMASTVYMWTKRLTLYKYQDRLFINDTISSDYKKWASMGPFYKDYGLYIIKQYPSYYARYFLWPNANKYYAPPIEFLESYNSGRDTVTNIAKNWFGYKSNNVYSRLSENNVWTLNFYPILSGIVNLIMLCSLICYIIQKGWKHTTYFNSFLILCSSLWIVNAVFTIFASSAALRFQSFPILLTTTCAVLMIDWMVQLMKKMNTELKNSKPVISELTYQS